MGVQWDSTSVIYGLQESIRLNHERRHDVPFKFGISITLTTLIEKCLSDSWSKMCICKQTLSDAVPI